MSETAAPGAPPAAPTPPPHWWHEAGRNRRFVEYIGPGWITGASDDDPSGIATYSQAGAQFGYGLAWVMLFTWPLMAAIQEISGRIGRITGQGIAGNLAAHYPRWLAKVIVLLLVFANVLNLGADLGAMGDATHLLVGGPRHLYVVVFAVFCALLETFSQYKRYAAILKWTALSLFAYVATAFVVHIPWREVAVATFIPSLALHRADIVTIVAVLGTTITPYCFFWQSSEEAEEQCLKPTRRRRWELQRIRLDTYLGMFFSNVIAWFIIVTTAATLHAHGVTNINTSAQAAEALRPIAGVFTFIVFAAGIIGIGLLAVPVLAGSAAYAVGEVFGWRTGLACRPVDAKAFYGTIVVGTLLGTLFNFVAIDPMKALYWCAVINGVVAVPLMAMIMMVAMRRKIMGAYTLPLPLTILGWLATLAMTAAVAIMIITL